MFSPIAVLPSPATTQIAVCRSCPCSPIAMRDSVGRRIGGVDPFVRRPPARNRRIEDPRPPEGGLTPRKAARERPGVTRRYQSLRSFHHANPMTIQTAMFTSETMNPAFHQLFTSR